MRSTLNSIAICGNGLAAQMVIAALARTLDPDVTLLQLSGAGDDQGDLLYGQVTAPTAYPFLQSIGLDEPTLFQKTKSSFSYGTQYKDWPLGNTWVQAHHLPFPLIDGTPLQHFLTRRKRPLDDLLISAQAGLSGRFAHPPEDPNLPLSRAEYGYQFSPNEWAACLADQRAEGRVQHIRGNIAKIVAEAGCIKQIHLQSDVVIESDLFIDCTGLQRSVVSSVGGAFDAKYSSSVSLKSSQDSALGTSMRIVEGQATGWTSTNHLDGARQVLTVRAPGLPASECDANVEAELGRLREAWVGNCIAIGQSAHALEPLTPAPMMLLQQDVERLLELIPIEDDTSAERKEYNRRFNDDADHAELFQTAIMIGSGHDNGAYWTDVRRHAPSEKLERKLSQFESRGLLAKYDLEPFNDEDWLIMHNGIGRSPKRYDRQVDHLTDLEIDQRLNGLAQAVQAMVSRMPPHALYMQKMKRYFEKQNYV